MATLDNTSGLEALRLFVACCGVAVSLWGLLRAGDGKFAFASVIRDRMIADRRTEMIAFLAINLVLGFQTTIAAATPDPLVLTPGALGANLSPLVTLLLLLGLALQQVHRWTHFEEVVGAQPLNPTDSERMTETARIGRPMLHTLVNDLAISASAIELLLRADNLTPEQAADLRMILERHTLAAGQVHHLQRLVRSLGGADDLPMAPPGEEGTA